ncbi:MAG TPA: stage II sporulation protein M [Steroidobacteraceae bacterium]|nr:stage II sporulation protein M [Steroidobacteraceae bacterium]
MNAAADARLAALASPPVIAVPSATGVDAQVVLAGPGARTIAFLIDFLIRAGLALAWLLVAALLILGNVDFQVPDGRETLWYLGGAIPATAIYFLYHPVLEPLMGGRTPGKRMTGLRVLTPEGVVPGVGALVTRNLFRIIDSMPALYVVGLLFVIFGRRHLRLGDMAAGTVLAVERAHFLEKLEAARGASADHAALQAARRRAAALGRRRGSDVREALAVVEDYRQAARALGAARAGGGDEYLEASYADLHDVIHRPARRLRDVLLALLRDRVPAAMHTMRYHTFGVTMLFVISAVAGFWLIYSYPDLIAMFASPQLIATVERGELWTEGLLNVTPSAVLSVSILTNNIIVSLFAFCSGIVFGLGTFYLIGLNGFSLGAIFAFTGQHGLAGKLFDFVIAHGCVELSCICISGAAGSLIGEALIRPGARTRSEAFGAAARDGVCVLIVVTLLLFVCGFIEGYISPDPEVPRWARVTIGVGYWLFMISVLRGYVFGRSRGGPPIRA